MTNAYIIINKKTNIAIAETYNKDFLVKINKTKYELKLLSDYLTERKKNE